MPEFSFEAFSILLLLLPGFLTARLIQSLCVRPSQTDFDKTIEAFLYSFIVYSIFVGVFQRSAFEVLVRSNEDGSKVYSPLVQPRDILLLLAISLVTALVVSGSTTNDLHRRLFRLFRLTQRTTRSSVWGDVFHELAYYVQVQFTDGRRVIGWPRYYSDTPEESTIFLENAAWISPDGKTTDIAGPGILITKSMQIETILFLKGQPKP